METTSSWFAPALLAGLLVAPASASAADEPEQPEEHEASSAELAKAVQNPVADLISVPFQNNVGYDIGAFNRSNWILDIEPVVPLHVSKEWMIVTRTIIPFVYQPNVNATGGASSGMGDINPTLFLSPAHPGAVIWGIGPSFLLPTATQATTGTGKWAIGPSAVALMQTKHWTLGTLVSNLWSFAGIESRASVNHFLLQYFVTYNLPDSWYLTSSPIITADWNASSGNKWTVPFGGGFGKVFKLGKQPLNGYVQLFADPIHPDTPPSPTWELRFQLSFLFPTARPKPPAAAAAGAPAIQTTVSEVRVAPAEVMH